MDRKQAIKYVLFALAAIVLVACVFGVIHYLDNRPDGKGGGRAEAVPDPMYLYFGEKEYEVKDNIKTYLVMGTDGVGKRPNSKNYHGPMTDFWLLLVINKTKESYGFIQIDRDTMANVDMILNDGDANGAINEEMQICTTTWYGKDFVQGCENAVVSTEDLLGGIDIDGYYSLNMKHIKEVNKAVGGVTVKIEDDFSELDPAMKMGEEIKLTDQQAYYFVQSRKQIGDGTNIGRMRRQKAYMQGLMDKSKISMGQDKSFAVDVFQELKDYATTDIPMNRVSAIANLLYKYENKGIFDIEGEHTEGRVVGDKKDYVQFYADEESMAKIFTELAGLDEGHTY